MADKLMCELEHDRPVRATIKVEVKSTRAGRPGHPMIRARALCAAHARKLRELGFEVVDG